MAILKLRAEKALKKEKIDPGALNKIAAFASRETGDARKAIDLLAKAVQIAENKTGYVGLDVVDLAEKKLEIMGSLPNQVVTKFLMHNKETEEF